MDKMVQSCKMTRNLFQEELRSKRVWMGYLLGIAILGYLLKNFICYVQDTGEPVNVLGAFVVLEQHYMNMLFLVVSWLLIISDAPFIRGNTYYLLYRSSRRRWNVGMLLYILSHAFLYVACIAGITVIVSSFYGFVGKMWSSPVFALAKDYGMDLGVKYNITFSYEGMMQRMTVPQAFGVVFLYMYLYLVFLGILLYVCNLILKGVYGVVIVMLVHISGYLLQADGLTEKSLLARAVPGNFIWKSGCDWSSVYLFVGLILVLGVFSVWMVRRVDFKEETEEEA